jgi:hypothetical protein
MSKITEVGEDTVLGVSVKTLIALAIGSIRCRRDVLRCQGRD